jgi:hypothetical protein
MLTEPPSYIKAAGVIGAPLKYKWNSDLAMDLDDVENDRLYSAIDESSFRAKMAIASVLMEWVAWRFQGVVDITDALARAEAAWVSVIDPAYSKSLEFETNADDDAEKALAPLESALSDLGDAWTEYVKGSIYLAEPVMKLAMLTRHLMPDKKRFDEWLSTALRRTAKTFPRGVTYDETSRTYDASGERPVPRAFFEQNFSPSDAAIHDAIAAFLMEAELSKNSYLLLHPR